MGLELKYDFDQTPLDEDEREGLKITTITTRSELDEFEQNSIEKAVQWTLKHRFKAEKLFSAEFLTQLHRKMFGDLWSWAGDYRKTNKNLGVDKNLISTEIKKLNDDASYWREQNSFAPDELAIRFKHRLVSIHPFPNGNGRHSRLVADVIISHLFEQPVFSWGGESSINKADNIRKSYIVALRAADRGKYQRLLDFARA